MFEPFITFVRNHPKPSNFYINKGTVKVINSPENFWIKYPNGNEVKINANEHEANITMLRDDSEVIINVSGLETCRVNLTSGIMDIDDLCQKSYMSVENGVLNAHVSNLEICKITGHVDNGILHNNTNLQAQNSHHNGAWTNSWQGMFNNYMQNVNHINLLGNTENFAIEFAEFSVKSGILNFD